MLKKILKRIQKKMLMPVLERQHKLEMILHDQNKQLIDIIKKLSLADEIIELKGARFWVPNAPFEFIQNVQLSEVSFYEQEILESLDKYLNQESIVIDVGANVGNHTVYWGKITNVRKVFSFEPIKATFKILEKNITINDLTKKVTAYNIGLGSKTAIGREISHNMWNAAVTEIIEDISGDITIKRLDDIKEIRNEKIDFIKIDVEGFEKNVLEGAVETITKNRPIVFIESLPQDNNLDFVKNYFSELGYNEPIDYQDHNFLFIHKQ